MYLTAMCIKTMTRGPFTKTINLTGKIRKTRSSALVMHFTLVSDTPLVTTSNISL